MRAREGKRKWIENWIEDGKGKIDKECRSVFKQLYDYFHEKAKTDKAYERTAEATDKQIKSNVLGIEQDEIEAEKASQYGMTIMCNDFFNYYQNNIDERTKFDVIICY